MRLALLAALIALVGCKNAPPKPPRVEEYPLPQLEPRPGFPGGGHPSSRPSP